MFKAHVILTIWKIQGVTRERGLDGIGSRRLFFGGDVYYEAPAGDSSLIQEFWMFTKVEDVYETCLVISNADGTSQITVPISSNFSGARYPHPSDPGSYITITEELPVPENVWQMIPIEHLEILLVLRDTRPSFAASPRPVLEAYSYAGVKLYEYTTLVDQIIQDEIYTDDVLDVDNNLIIAAGTCRWEFHGAPTLNEDRPGPRMKVSWPGENSDKSAIRKLTVDGDPNKTGDILIHTSVECFENLKGDGTNYLFESEYDYKTRVEYRQLRYIPGTGFVVVYSGYKEKTCTKGSNRYIEQDMIFPSELPRPDALIGMAFTESKFYFQELENLNWKIKEKAIEPDVGVTP